MIKIIIDGENPPSIDVELTESDLKKLGYVFGHTIANIAIFLERQSGEEGIAISVYDGVLRQIKDKVVSDFQESGVMKEGQCRLSDML